MLTQRTNVLLSPDEHGLLLALSREHNKTMGELIRQAIKKTYATGAKDAFGESLARIRQMTSGVRVKKAEYRNWVVEGRKYEE
ncbi:MAG: hypothetical protein ACD_40C00057G0006 [uncultured bacterium]|nr:MAG: hypothetical protein ACD_40C00057G0006 [uncultured bacterium]